MIARPDWRIPAENYNRMMQRCIELTGDEAFGLCAAEQLQPQVLHGLGLGWLASDTVYEGLQRLVRFCKLIASMSEVRLEEHDREVKLFISGAMRSSIDNFQYSAGDYGVGMVVRMCQLNLGTFLSPVRIEMQRPTPNDPSRWDYMLATRVSFEHDETCIVWSRADIQEQLVTGDPALARVVDEHTALNIEAFMNSSISGQVSQKIIRRLPDGPPSQKQIADDLCMSNRTLQRKLKTEGASFSGLLQESRQQLAQRYLQQPARSIVEISYLLGFAEPSAFSRAFKRWTGETPAHFSELHRTKLA